MKLRSCLLFLLVPITAVAQMTHEETLVRTAYAKYAYAVAQGAITDVAIASVAHHNQPPAVRPPSGTLTFTLSDFSVGNLRDILTRNISEFVTARQGYVFAVDSGSQAYNDTRWHFLRVRWIDGGDGPPTDLTVADGYKLQWQGQEPQTRFERYAAYTVTVSYEQRSRTYKAMFLFGHDPSGNEQASPVDPITNNIGLAYALRDPLFPEMATTKLRTNQAVRDWLEANTADQTCATDKHDVCCDLVRMRCGPGRTDLQNALSKRIEKEEER